MAIRLASDSISLASASILAVLANERRNGLNIENGRVGLAARLALEAQRDVGEKAGELPTVLAFLFYIRSSNSLAFCATVILA
jgi:hypothetical protein